MLSSAKCSSASLVGKYNSTMCFNVCGRPHGHVCGRPHRHSSVCARIANAICWRRPSITTFCWRQCTHLCLTAVLWRSSNNDDHDDQWYGCPWYTGTCSPQVSIFFLGFHSLPKAIYQNCWLLLPLFVDHFNWIPGGDFGGESTNMRGTGESARGVVPSYFNSFVKV